MCMLCDDETAYKAHMDYLDSMQTQGRDAVSGVVQPVKARSSSARGSATACPHAGRLLHASRTPVGYCVRPARRSLAADGRANRSVSLV